MRPIGRPGDADRLRPLVPLAWLAFCIPVLFVRPALDDWLTSTPIPTFSWDSLRPLFFWRPFEVLLRLVSGQVPPLFPVLPKVFLVAGHALAVASVYRIARQVAPDRQAPALAASLFAISPACAAAVWSLDGTGEVWSTALGLVGVRLLLRGSPWWFVAIGVGALWKESGLAWFLAAPAIAMALTALTARSFRLARHLAVGAVSIAAYFVIRFALQADVPLPETGRYAVNLAPLVWLRNAAALVGVSAGTIDTLALFGPRNLAVAASAGVLGLPLAAVVARALAHGWTVPRWSCGSLAVAALLLPHLPQSHVSELYAYPVIAALATLAACVSYARTWRLATVSAIAFAAGALAVDAHKAIAMVHTGAVARTVGGAIVKAVPDPPATVCLVVPARDERIGYSVFLGEPGPAAGWGRAAHAHWGWRTPVAFAPVVSSERCRPATDIILSVDRSGAFTVERPGDRQREDP